MIIIGYGALTGLLFGASIIALIRSLPRFNRMRLVDRIGPLLYDRSAAVVQAKNVKPQSLIDYLAQIIDSCVGGRQSTRKKLERIHSSMSIADFRVKQISASVIGFVITIVVFFGIDMMGYKWSLGQILLSAGLVSSCAIWVCEWLLNQSVRRRNSAIIDEFPPILDLVALSLTAGETVFCAFDRIIATSQGEFTRDLQLMMIDIRSGTPLVQALRTVADRLDIAAVNRFSNGLTIALERGTPLAQVLRAQALDIRHDYKRRLLILGGKKEIAMLVPVVFLILPITVLFALYPGLIMITHLN